MLCTCGEILRDPEHVCLLHPHVVVKPQDEKAAFATGWDAKVVAGRG